MNKFDNIINEFVSTQNISLTPNLITTARKDMSSTPTSVKDTLEKVADVVNPDNADPFQRKLSDIIDPESKTSFNDLTPEEQKKAIEILGKAGIPIDSVKTSKEETNNQQNQTSSISNSTSYSA